MLKNIIYSSFLRLCTIEYEYKLNGRLWSSSKKRVYTRLKDFIPRKNHTCIKH